ncbi:pyridoxal phosphate-dependent transferase [Artemisia annua]|uniref:Pyridoxal phosphate-dependent transferase n=1 Tax=Artemisia annua TaxID=35608 RepID=A0A2U1QHF4_ARTAN|nr:pyridoxal phosphate-dependent transferase [Artemisia annua]
MLESCIDVLLMHCNKPVVKKIAMKENFDLSMQFFHLFSTTYHRSLEEQKAVCESEDASVLTWILKYLSDDPELLNAVKEEQKAVCESEDGIGCLGSSRAEKAAQGHGHASNQYELLNEMMDFGYPQYTEAQIISEFIKTDTHTEYKYFGKCERTCSYCRAIFWHEERVHGYLSSGCDPYVDIDMGSAAVDDYDAITLSPHKFLGGPGSPRIILMNKALYQLKNSPHRHVEVE